MTRSHPPLKWMGNFKAVAIDYEFYLTLSDKPQSVCLTERQMYVLSVQNTYTYWLTRWYNTDDITQKTVEFIAAEIEGLLMCGCGVPVPSITDILNAQTYTTSTYSTYVTTYNTWNDAGQTVYSIAPNLDYGSGVPADIDKLMCWGLRLFLDGIVEQAKAMKQGELEDAKDITKQLAGVFGALGVAGGAASVAGGAAAGLVAFLGGPYLLLGLALATVGLAVASIVMPMDLSVFTDEEAFEEVYCTMVVNMVGSNPTQASFTNALTPNEFEPGSHAAQLAAVVQPYLASVDTYLQFLVAMNGLYEVSNFGVLEECGCSEPPDPNCTDTTSEKGLWDIYATVGTWELGNGFVAKLIEGVWYLYLRQEAIDEGVSKLVVQFTTAVASIQLQYHDGSGVFTSSATPTTEVEFSAATFPDTWTDRNAALGLQLIMANIPAGTRVVEICEYYVEA